MDNNTPKDRPILFNGAMVRAVLDGSKTQTRRVVKPQPEEWTMVRQSGGCYRRPDGRFAWTTPDGIAVSDPFVCPYGVPGDRLWVRETYYLYAAATNQGQKLVDFHGIVGYVATRGDDTKWINKSDDPDGYERYREFARARGVKFDLRNYPSIHMPRWASRITLEVTDVRVERVQDISEDDAKAEGCREPDSIASDRYWPTYRDGFIKLWDSINAKRGYGWAENPWVWVVGFKTA